MRKKTGTREKWTRFATLLKAAQYLTTEALILGGEIMTDKELYQLRYTEDRLSAARSGAEDIMWTEPDETLRDCNIFYGLYSPRMVCNPYQEEADRFGEQDKQLPINEQCPDMVKILRRNAEVFDVGVNAVLNNIGLMGKRGTLARRLG